MKFEQMIDAKYCQLMAEYNVWMNTKLYHSCSLLPETVLHEDKGAFFKSIYLTLNHIAYSDLAFLSRFTGQPADVPPLGSDLFGGFQQLYKERKKIDARLIHWSMGLQTQWLEQPLTYVSKVDGSRRTAAHWVLVVHLFNHQIHHRGQLSTLLTQQGLDLGSTDLPFMPQFDHDRLVGE